jgi:conjugative transposon TraM protein
VQVETTANQLLEKLNQFKSVTQPQAGAKGGWVGQTMEPYPGAMYNNRQTFQIQPPAVRASQPNNGPHPDAGMSHLEGMLDKIFRIQHPDLVHADTADEGVEVALLQQPRKEEPVRVLAAGGETRSDGAGETFRNAFMEIDETSGNDSMRLGDAISAVVAGDQTLTAGTTVALRLSQEATVKGQRVPAGQEVNGVATLSGERLNIAISSIRVGQTLVNVSLQVYDLDGLPGIRVPGALTRDVSKQSADQALSGLGIASLDQNLSAQAASAGLQFAKSLASRKVRLVRVSLPAGYRVLLRNSKSINH